MANSLPSKPSTTIVELAACSALAVSIWISTMSVFFPLFALLVLSPWLRQKFFCWIMKTFIAEKFPEMSKIRENLFDMVKDEFSVQKTIRVLEIGVGSGRNFEYFPENFSLTLLDANPNFLSVMKSKLGDYPQLKVDGIIYARAEDMSELKDEEYDLALCTHLLCSVSDVDAVLSETWRILKVGGKFAFMEHVGFPENHFAYRIQRCLSPLWKVYFAGCHLHRWPHKEVERRFSKLNCKVMYPSFLPLFFQPHAVGIATK